MSNDNSFAKFVSLCVAVLMFGAMVACIVYSSILYAVPAGVITAYALGLYFDMSREELVESLRGDSRGHQDGTKSG